MLAPRARGREPRADVADVVRERQGGDAPVEAQAEPRERGAEVRLLRNGGESWPDSLGDVRGVDSLAPHLTVAAEDAPAEVVWHVEVVETAVDVVLVARSSSGRRCSAGRRDRRDGRGSSLCCGVWMVLRMVLWMVLWLVLMNSSTTSFKSGYSTFFRVVVCVVVYVILALGYIFFSF